MLLFNTWWESLPGIQQALWIVALVGSILSIILLLLSYSGLDEESSPSDRSVRHTRWGLLFLTMAGWAGVLTAVFSSHTLILGLGAICGGLLALGIRLFFYYRQNTTGTFHLQDAISRTGKVLRAIPPHKAGYGTVQIDLRKAPYQIEAITATDDLLEPGRKVRVVEVVDDKLLRVEPLRLEPNGGHALRETPGRKG